MKTTTCETFIASSKINDQAATKAGGQPGLHSRWHGFQSERQDEKKRNVMVLSHY